MTPMGPGALMQRHRVSAGSYFMSGRGRPLLLEAYLGTCVGVVAVGRTPDAGVRGGSPISCCRNRSQRESTFPARANTRPARMPNFSQGASRRRARGGKG
ncbi:MAG: hypothetical protein MZV70_57005 [Desulfobacterales bacterium]|nr:hypothetical protein [Desulfobacterales bacterium]